MGGVGGGGGWFRVGGGALRLRRGGGGSCCKWEDLNHATISMARSFLGWFLALGAAER